ncbi:MAG: DNA-binding response regulator [Paenibacillus sp.]|jgi:two-component system response regulator YesN|nr:DNA-binding response regulator [Paenibacillus sp.]
MRTYTCLIVDDEHLILQRLELFFAEAARSGHKFTLVGKAYSGRKGLEAALALTPDIVVTDIVMPGMNGIEMTEALHTQLPLTQVIILSAHSDFHYTKRAIQAGVADYIVKVPLDERALLQALEKAVARLKQAEQKESEVRRLNMSLLENRYQVRKPFLADYLHGAMSAQRAEEYASRHQLFTVPGTYCAFVVELGEYASFQRQYDLADQRMLTYGLCNIIEETVGTTGAGFASELDDHTFIGFVSWPDSRSAVEWERRCRELGQAICANGRSYIKRPLSVGFSGIAHGWPMMASAYAQAKQACNDAFYWELGAVVTQATAILYDGEEKRWSSAFHSIVAQLEAGTLPDQLEEAVAEVQAQLIEHKASREDMSAILKHFLLAARGKIHTWMHAVPPNDDTPLLYMTFREQLDYVKRMISDSLRSGIHPYLRPEIAKAKQYIERHVTKRLSLQEVADHVNLTPTYFSSLFKKEMNEGMVEYVNRLKINKSLELLRQCDYTIQELCDEVGIVNEGYFCKLFKHSTGQSPKQYRLKAIQGNRSDRAISRG